MNSYSINEKVFETILIGESLGELSKEITANLMMSYGAATWDYAPIHYDAYTARRFGFRGPIADGQMLGAFLIQLVQNWAGHYAYIEKLSFQNKQVVYAGDKLICKGYVQQKDEEKRVIGCKLWIENDQGQIILDNGFAAVSFAEDN